MKKPWQVLLLGLFGMASMAVPATSQIILQTVVVGSGGTQATDGSNGLVGTVGQAVIGPATSATADVWQGFWYTLPPENSVGAVPGRQYDPAAAGIMLYQNVPNPFSTTTELQFQIPRRTHVSLKLFDAVGHEVRTLVEGDEDAGLVAVKISAENLESGYYTARLVADGVAKSIAMVVVK